jgi:catalase
MSYEQETEPQEPAQDAAAGLSRRGLLAAMGAGAGAVAFAPHLAFNAAAAPAAVAAVPAVEQATALPGSAAIVAPAAAEPADGSPPVQEGELLTTNTGTRVADDQNTLRAGTRGPSLLEDFHFREKMTHFDHERIPERVVHARGAGAHGVFQVYESLADVTSAAVFSDPNVQTEVFVRFSTVNGSRGSSDLARDARGFATKFYTSEGVWDLVGNNIPVFFIQDAIKFPDLVHSFKPEPHTEFPQASTAHDTFWDFISLTPESLHMIMWIMSDRALPRSYRMMDGFGVHTFRLVNARGDSTYAKFHWRSPLGAHSVLWDEAQKISGKDPDFHRRDLWDAIAAGQFPEYELGVQLFDDHQAGSFGFDILDATKLVPEDVVPIRPIGKMTLNRNPDNYFVETEQVAFHVGHVVNGIDFTDDPLLQGRLFSYLDTQINRFGGANFHQLPINQSRSAVNNYQQDSSMRYANRSGRVNYEPNSLGGDAREATAAEGGYVSYPERVQGSKIRSRSETFADYKSQARLFWNSVTDPERLHIVQALQFELAKVTTVAVQQRMLTLLADVDPSLTAQVAAALGLAAPGGNPANIGTAAGISQIDGRNSAATRKVAILAWDGVDASDVNDMKAALLAAGLLAVDVVAPHLGTVTASDGSSLKVDQRILDVSSVLYDALYIPTGGALSAPLDPDVQAEVIHFIRETFKHYKALAVNQDLAGLVFDTALADVPGAAQAPGIVVAATAQQAAGAFITAIAAHRHFDRTTAATVSA